MDFSKIYSSAQEKAIQSMLNRSFPAGVKETPENKELVDEINYNRTLIKFCVSLLEEYHKELKAELQKSGINLD